MPAAQYLAIRHALDIEPTPRAFIEPTPRAFIERYAAALGFDSQDEAIETIDWEGDARQVLDSFRTVLEAEPPTSEIQGLWFGLHEESDGEISEVSFYVLGYPTYSKRHELGPHRDLGTKHRPRRPRSPHAGASRRPSTRSRLAWRSL